MADKSGPVLGIDFGMTSVVAAHVPAPGQPPKVIPIDKGDNAALPAVVAYVEGKGPVVGRGARDMLTTEPTRTVFGVKRLLGRKPTSQAVKDLSQRVGFKIVERGGGVAIEIGDKRLAPAEVAAVLLTQVKLIADKHLGTKVTRAVIAVPAYFNSQQKDEVKEAARLAGLEVEKLVHEPTAAALAYGYNKVGDARIVILDMGGIRLDVSVMEITGNVFDVVATGGDPYLGGANIDARIGEWILGNVKKKHGKDLAQEPALLMKVRTAAEQAKRELSKHKAVDLQIPLEVGKKEKAKTASLRLNTSTLEKLSEDIVQRVLSVTQHVLKERGLSPKDIDDVVLVGGATRLGLLRKRLKDVFGREPRSTLPPEEVIALGSALLAESLQRGDAVPLADVLAEPIGIALADGRFMRIIDKDSKLPITRRVMIPSVRDNQRSVEVDLFQGDSDDILDVEYLGTIVFSGLPDGKAGESKLVVDLVLGVDRVLTVSSPEEGRAGEKLELFTKEHEKVKNAKGVTPVFVVAKNPPKAAVPAG